MYVNDLHEFLNELAHTHFYGMIEIRFESGHVATIRKIESLKVSGDEPRKFREGTNDSR